MSAGLNIYPLQSSIYPVSTDYTLVVNGRTVPVQKYSGYDIAQFAMGPGAATIAITKTNNTEIGSFSITPAKLNLVGKVTGSTLTFSIPTPQYLIVAVDSRPRLVLAIDPPDADRPASSGTGIFNVTRAPYNAVSGTGAYQTTAFQTALNDAAAWGTANGRQGICYVPPGVWTVGNLYLRSDLAFYLEPGAVLRYTGERVQYTKHWHKLSQQRDITWFISTRYSSKNITLYGRGIIDGNGMASVKVDNLAANLLVPIYTTDFTCEGITFRESNSWAIMPTRGVNMTFRNLKMFNRFDMGENDGIDVMESDNVRITNAIGIGLDDPFSTKTWANDIDLFLEVPGQPRPLNDVVFDELVSWTYCYGFKVGQGVIQPQTNVTFKNGAVYDCAVGIGVHHKYGDAAATKIAFENIDIERCSHDNDNPKIRTWLALWTGANRGVGPVTDVRITNVRVRNAGTTPARVRGQPGALITGVVLDGIFMPGTNTPASTLDAMNLTDVSNNGPITITSGLKARSQEVSARMHKRDQMSWERISEEPSVPLQTKENRQAVISNWAWKGADFDIDTLRSDENSRQGIRGEALGRMWEQAVRQAVMVLDSGAAIAEVVRNAKFLAPAALMSAGFMWLMSGGSRDSVKQI